MSIFNTVHKSLFFTLILLFAYAHLKATHIMGADITWEANPNYSDSIKVTVNFYRDCNGTSAVLKTLTVSSKNRTKIYSLTKSYVSDITPLCKRSCTRCASRSCSWKYGVQSYKGVTWVNLDSFGTDCEITFAFGECCRNGSITTGAANQNFYVESMHNRCLAFGDNSPKFIGDPVLIVCIGRDFVYNGGSIDVDTTSNGFSIDSLSYDLAEPKVSKSSKTNFSGSYTYKKPLTFLGFPKAQKSFPFGFHLDSASGQFLFRPLKAEVAVVTYAVSSFRKGKLAGYVTRDIQIIIVKCPNNNAPVVSGKNCSNAKAENFEINACVDQTIDFTICTADYDKSDTVEMSVLNYGKKGTVYINSSTRSSARFVWKPTKKDVRKEPYYVAFTANDNACPVIGVASRIVAIYVTNDSIGPKVSFQQNNREICGEYSINSKGIGIDSHKWYLNNTLMSIDTLMSFRDYKPGKYPVRLDFKSGQCWFSRYDTIEVKQYKKISLANLSDTGLCLPKNISRTFKATGGNGKLSYSWQKASAASPAKGNKIALKYPNASRYENVYYTATDSAGCSVSDTFMINVTPQYGVSIQSDTLFCQDSIVNFKLPLFKKQNGYWYGNGVTKGIFNSKSLRDSIYKVNFVYADYGICLVDSALLTVSHLPKPKLWSELDSVCSRHRPIKLHAIPGGGTWYGHIRAPDSVFQQLGSPDSVYNLSYTYVNTLGCSNTLPLDVTVHDYSLNLKVTNDSSFCYVNDTLVLNESPKGGVWSGSSNLLNRNDTNFLVFSNQTRNYNLSYLFEDSFKCFDKKEVRVKVKEVSKLYMPNGKQVCLGAKNRIKFNAPAPFGGVFSGDSLYKDNGNYYLPVDSSTIGKTVLTYTFINSVGCQSKDSIYAVVFAPKKLKTLNDTNICIGLQKLYVPINDTNGNWNKPWWFSKSNDSAYLDAVRLAMGKNDIFYITTDSNNCIARADFSVVKNDIPTVSVSSDSIVCVFPKSKIVLNANPKGGQWFGKGLNELNDSTYFISDATLVGENNYRYHYTDSNGCTNSDSTKITLRSMPGTKGVITADSFCADSIWYRFKTLNKNAIWVDTNVVADSIGYKTLLLYQHIGIFHYFFKVNDSFGCENYDSTYLIKGQPVKAGFTISDSAGRPPHQVLFTSAFADSSNNVLWDLGDGTISNRLNPSHTYDSIGIFTVAQYVEDSTGICKDYVILDSVIRTDFVGMRTLNNQYIVYPNPTKGVLTIKGKGDTQFDLIEIYDATGRMLKRERSVNYSYTFDFDAYAEGLYFIKIGSAGKVSIMEIVKQ